MIIVYNSVVMSGVGRCHYRYRPDCYLRRCPPTLQQSVVLFKMSQVAAVAAKLRQADFLLIRAGKLQIMFN